MQLPDNWYGEMMEHRGETNAHLTELDRDIKEIKQSVKEIHTYKFQQPSGGSNGYMETRKQRNIRRVKDGGRTGGLIALGLGTLELVRFVLST